jgi:glycosyltransferase involved in cell wall biosynthesis
LTAFSSPAPLHVGFVYVDVPDPGYGGASLMAYTLIEALLAAGHRVTMFSLSAGEPESRREETVARLRELGSRLRTLPPPAANARPESRARARAEFIRQVFWPRDAEVFPSTRQAEDLRAAFAEEQVDAGLAFSTEAITASHQGLGVPVVAVMGDPPGLSRRVRMKYAPAAPWSARPRQLVYRLTQVSFWLHADRRLLSMLRRFPSVGMLGAQHAKWAEHHGVRAWHAHAPVTDLGGPNWRARRAAAPRRPKPTILLIGHLRGATTIAGLHLFADSILPGLTARLGEDGFEARVVGGYEPPTDLGAKLRHPAVKLLGQIAPADDEFLSADVMLVPTPVKMGQRTRILTAMSFGCCVVAHAANRLGIPDLAHGENTLLAEDGPGLVDALVTALADPDLRERLGRNGRRTYESTSIPERAGARIVEELERVARA